MFCTKCGKEIKTPFCVYCGEKANNNETNKVLEKNKKQIIKQDKAINGLTILVLILIGFLFPPLGIIILIVWVVGTFLGAWNS